jgi:hypothetical protein
MDFGYRSLPTAKLTHGGVIRTLRRRLNLSPSRLLDRLLSSHSDTFKETRNSQLVIYFPHKDSKP